MAPLCVANSIVPQWQRPLPPLKLRDTSAYATVGHVASRDWRVSHSQAYTKRSMGFFHTNRTAICSDRQRGVKRAGISIILPRPSERDANEDALARLSHVAAKHEGYAVLQKAK